MEIDPKSKKDLSAQIAQAIREAIVSGSLTVDERLPSEAELAEKFSVSRSSVREALKRLAAQSLIRTERGAFGGAFVNRLTFDAARDQQVTTSTLLLSMNEVSFQTASQARFAMERACVPLACTNRSNKTLNDMSKELTKQTDDALSDEAFCASDVAFHRALVDGTCNPILSYQLAGAVEAMQPLMNMITFTARSRAKIVVFHGRLLDALTQRRDDIAEDALSCLEDYTIKLGQDVITNRAKAARR
jgi:DNA-binding FadR family transcriptional regulator